METLTGFDVLSSTFLVLRFDDRISKVAITKNVDKIELEIVDKINFTDKICRVEKSDTDNQFITVNADGLLR